MRYAMLCFAVFGMIVSALALRVHYSSEVQICDINATWDCGTVSHSRYSSIMGIPVAALGIAGYGGIAVLALLRRRHLLVAASSIGLVFALYLSYIEANVLHAWCLYCVISQAMITLLFALSATDVSRDWVAGKRADSSSSSSVRRREFRMRSAEARRRVP